MKLIPLLAMLSLVMSSQGCQQTPTEQEAQANNPKSANTSTDSVYLSAKQQVNKSELLEAQNMADKNTISVSGRIEYKSFEGGFYAFVADDGRQFTPTGLAPEYRQHGLPITLKGVPMPDVITTTQFGVVFKVESVVKVEESDLKVKPSIPANPADI